VDFWHLSPDEWTAVALSLKVALVAMLASLPFGIAAALLLSRGRFAGKALLNGLIHLPLVLPPVVTGYILLLLFGRRGPIGGWLAEHVGLVFSFRWTGAALAGAVMGFPLMAVTLRLALPGVIAGMILAFAKSMGEFGATITFVSNIPGETQTLAAAIYGYTQVPGGDAGALKLTLVAVALSMAALIASEALAARMRRP